MTSGYYGHGKCHWLLACGCSVPIPDRAPWLGKKRNAAVSKTLVIFVLYIGDYITQLYIYIYIGIVVSVYKDPYEPISRMVLAPLNQKLPSYSMKMVV